jgi:hypothetical protein
MTKLVQLSDMFAYRYEDPIELSTKEVFQEKHNILYEGYMRGVFDQAVEIEKKRYRKVSIVRLK